MPKEFQQYITPDDGRKFTELYNVQHLTTNVIDPVNKVTITTIQRLYSMLSYFEPIEEKDVPSNSLLREFIGGSTFFFSPSSSLASS